MTFRMPDADADHAALLKWLADHDELCPACRYDLRGLAAIHCPECDSRLTLSVSSPDIRLGPWLLAVISFALGLGFDAVVCVLFAVGATIALASNPPAGSGPPPSFYVLPASLIVLALACFTGIAWLVRRRHRWLRLTPRAQWKGALAVFVGVGAVHLFVGIVFIVLN